LLAGGEMDVSADLGAQAASAAGAASSASSAPGGNVIDARDRRREGLQAPRVAEDRVGLHRRRADEGERGDGRSAEAAGKRFAFLVNSQHLAPP
jgi:hypothetical protein